jgi:hypothetical protein
MNDHLLPTSLPIATAAIIAGLSPATFRSRCLAPGLVGQDEDHKVSLSSLAAYLGRPIDLETYLQGRRNTRARR